MTELPPPYPPPGFGPAPDRRPYSVGGAFGWAWAHVSTASAAAAAIYGALFFVVSLAATFALSVAFPEAEGSHPVYQALPGFAVTFNGGGAAVALVGTSVTVLVQAAAQACYTGGLLDVLDGRTVETAAFFQPRRFGPAFLVGTCVSAVTYAAIALAGLVGGPVTSLLLAALVVVLAATVFAFPVFAVIDRSLSATAGVRAAVRVTVRHPLGVLGVVALALLLNIVGLLLCVVGLVVTYPVGLLATGYAWRKLSGGVVAAA